LFEFDVEPLGDSENITKHRRLDSPRKHLHDSAQTISRSRENPHTFVRERWISAHEEARPPPVLKCMHRVRQQLARLRRARQAMQRPRGTPPSGGGV